MGFPQKKGRGDYGPNLVVRGKEKGGERLEHERPSSQKEENGGRIPRPHQTTIQKKKEGFFYVRYNMKEKKKKGESFG